MSRLEAFTGRGTRTGPVVVRRHGRNERFVRRMQELATQARAERLPRTAWTHEARYDPADLGGGLRDAGATPLRSTRLT